TLSLAALMTTSVRRFNSVANLLCSATDDSYSSLSGSRIAFASASASDTFVRTATACSKLFMSVPCSAHHRCLLSDHVGGSAVVAAEGAVFYHHGNERGGELKVLAPVCENCFHHQIDGEASVDVPCTRKRLAPSRYGVGEIPLDVLLSHIGYRSLRDAVGGLHASAFCLPECFLLAADLGHDFLLLVSCTKLRKFLSMPIRSARDLPGAFVH